MGPRRSSSAFRTLCAAAVCLSLFATEARVSQGGAAKSEDGGQVTQFSPSKRAAARRLHQEGWAKGDCIKKNKCSLWQKSSSSSKTYLNCGSSVAIVEGKVNCCNKGQVSNYCAACLGAANLPKFAGCPRVTVTSPPQAPEVYSVEKFGDMLHVGIRLLSGGGLPINLYRVTVRTPTNATIVVTDRNPIYDKDENWMVVKVPRNKLKAGMKYYFTAALQNAKGWSRESKKPFKFLNFMGGNYTLTLVGRSSCSVRGYLVAPACGKTELSFTPKKGPLTRLTLVPERDRHPIVDSNRVNIFVAGGQSCDKYVQANMDCSDARFTFRPQITDMWDPNQDFEIQEAGGTDAKPIFRIQSRARYVTNSGPEGEGCSTTMYLGASTSCNSTSLMLTPEKEGPGFVSRWTLDLT